MKHLLFTALATSIGNIVTWLLYQGFINSYWGKNIREEISRAFNKLTKHCNKR